MVAGCRAACAAGEVANGAASGLPVPRFVSLKSDRVNVRGGPTKDHDVAWVFTRAGLPVEITAEFENWRRIRDWRRRRRLGLSFAAVRPAHRRWWCRRPRTIWFRSATSRTEALRDRASCRPACSASVKRCNGNWCRITGEGFDGWVAQERLWGVYPNEKVD